MGTVAGADEAVQAPEGTEPAPEQTPVAETEQPPEKPGFAERGQMRRRARFLRKARELAYRDLGGLVFDLHRFGQRNDPLVLAKLAMLRQLDTELRELERVLRERRSVTVLREVGIAACPRCAAIHGSDDRFCPGCGLAFDANADRPISTAPMAPTGAGAERTACGRRAGAETHSQWPPHRRPHQSPRPHRRRRPHRRPHLHRRPHRERLLCRRKRTTTNRPRSCGLRRRTE